MQKDLHRIILKKKPLLIHHWDADGIASAAKILKIDESLQNTTPPIGRYKITPRLNEEIRGHHELLILDWNIPNRDLIELDRRGHKVFMIDHHHRKIRPPKHIRYINPIEEAPSTSWIITEQLNEKIDMLTILGVCGDLEEKIKEHKAYPKIKRELKRSGQRLTDIMKLAKRLNILGQYGDRGKVNEAPRRILQKKLDTSKLLSEEDWLKIEEEIGKEIRRILKESLTITEKTVTLRFKSRFKITSSITRRLAKRYDKICIVIGENTDQTQIYIRRGRKMKIKLTPLIDRLTAKGYIAGGKENVIGIELNNEETDNCIKEIKEYIEGRRDE